MTMETITTMEWICAGVLLCILVACPLLIVGIIREQNREHRERKTALVEIEARIVRLGGGR